MNFFQCAFDASVTGLDVVATCARGWDNGQSTNFSASLNINNLTDKTYLANCGTFGCFYGEGRTVTAKVAYKW